MTARALLVSVPLAILLYFAFWRGHLGGPAALWLAGILGLPWSLGFILLCVGAQQVLDPASFTPEIIYRLGEPDSVLRPLVWGIFWSLVLGLHVNVHCALWVREWARRRRREREARAAAQLAQAISDTKYKGGQQTPPPD